MDTTLRPVTTKSLAAIETGIDENKIRDVVFELSYLRKSGLLVDITVSGIGMFTRSAQLGELGIGEDDEKAQRYSPGNKYLVPKPVVDRLRSVETRMRQVHQKFAIDVAGFRPYRWLPYTGYKNFRRRWDELKAEFESAKAEIIANLDSYRDLLAEEFATGARHTWAAIEGQGYTGMIFNGRGYLSRDEFMDAVVDLAMAQFPTAERIERELMADYSVGVIYTDIDLDAQRAIAEQEIAKSKAEAQAAYLRESILQEQARYEFKMHQLSQQEKELQIEAMMAAEMAHAKEQLETIRRPFEEVFISLRQQIAQAANEMLESVKKNGFVRGKIAERAIGLVEFYDLMAAHDDKELRAKLVELRNKIGAIGDQRTKDTPARSPEAVADTLKELVEMAKLEASELANMSRAAFLEV